MNTDETTAASPVPVLAARRISLQDRYSMERLRDLSLEIYKGDVVALVGAGAFVKGKDTLHETTNWETIRAFLPNAEIIRTETPGDPRIGLSIRGRWRRTSTPARSPIPRRNSPPPFPPEFP